MFEILQKNNNSNNKYLASRKKANADREGSRQMERRAREQVGRGSWVTSELGSAPEPTAGDNRAKKHGHHCHASWPSWHSQRLWVYKQG